QEQGGAKVPFGLAFDGQGDVATLVPSLALGAGKIYDVKVAAGVKDLAGNAVDPAAASSTVTFTVDNTSPSVSVQPANASTVGNNVNVQLTFNEGMDPRTIDADSFTLTFSSAKVFAAVWYDAPSRIAYLQPAAPLGDGLQTVALDSARVSDLAGNLIAFGSTFTVNSAGPSVVGTPTPCGTIVDVDNFGNQVIGITFDRGVMKSGGGALDSTALKLRIGGVDQAVTVTHTAGGSSATLVASGGSTPLAGFTSYEVLATTSVVASAAPNTPMASPYSCAFKTQKVVFKDLVDDFSTAGYTVGAAQGGNAWQRLNSVDDARNSIVWRGGNSTDGQSYARNCAALGATDYVVYVEKQVDLSGLTAADLRFDEWHDIQNTGAADRGRVLVRQGSTTTELYGFTGTSAGYSTQGKGNNLLGPYLGSTVTIRLELVIRGVSSFTCGTAPAGKKGLYADNIYVVGGW
ncbi:MAG: Ig-like domain-containing domain, partial [Myxococcaceae bacterium]